MNALKKEWLPDFLGIGAQKAGTTWLNENLRQHPEVWGPPIKEIHYFNRSYPASPSPLTSSSLIFRILGQGRQDRLWRKELVKRILSIREATWQEIAWYLQFFFGQYNDNWYAALFKSAGSQVKGEITPAYSFLDMKDIEHIKEIMPGARIIYIVRNPIDRAWSAAKSAIRHDAIRRAGWKGLFQHRQIASRVESISSSKFERKFNRIMRREGFLLRGDYVRTINNWQKKFSKAQFFIGFFEDIVHNPRQFLQTIFEFLGVDSSKEYITQIAFEKINPSPQREMPIEFRWRLANHYYSQIKTLSEMLGGYAIQWRKDAEKILLDD
jgi:hypothetical protein